MNFFVFVFWSHVPRFFVLLLLLYLFLLLVVLLFTFTWLFESLLVFNEYTLLELSRSGILLDNPNIEGYHSSESTNNCIPYGNKEYGRVL